MADKQKYAAYDRLVKRLTPNSNIPQGLLRAFWVGGLICMIGQGISMFGSLVMHLNMVAVASFTSIVLVFLGTTLTGIGVYDRIGNYAGAGSIVPITGFANSVAAPAIEFRREGLVLGVGAKLFTLAGPVLAYGISTSIIIGIVYFIAERCF